MDTHIGVVRKDAIVAREIRPSCVDGDTRELDGVLFAAFMWSARDDL